MMPPHPKSTDQPATPAVLASVPTVLPCDVDPDETPAEPDYESFAAQTFYLYADAAFRASKANAKNGAPVIDVDVVIEGHTAFSLRLSNAALANLLRAVAETTPDVRVMATQGEVS